jgi:hypothetical protein
MINAALVTATGAFAQQGGEASQLASCIVNTAHSTMKPVRN